MYTKLERTHRKTNNKTQPWLWETLKLLFLQTMKTQIKCRIKRHFIWVYTVWWGKKRSLDTKIQYFFKIKPDIPICIQWTIPSLLYQTSRKNQLVYKWLTYDTTTYNARNNKERTTMDLDPTAPKGSELILVHIVCNIEHQSIYWWISRQKL